MIDKKAIVSSLKLSNDEVVHIILITKAIINDSEFTSEHPAYRSSIISIYNKCLIALPDEFKAYLP